MRPSIHFQKCNFTGSTRFSNPSTAATALSPITCTQAAIGNRAFLTVSCTADRGVTRHNRRNSALTGRISEMLSGSRHGGRGTGFDRDKKKLCLVADTNGRNSALTGRISEMWSGSRHGGRGTGFDRDKKKWCLVPDAHRPNYALTGRISVLLSGSRHGGPGTGFDGDKNTSSVWFQTTVTALVVAWDNCPGQGRMCTLFLYCHPVQHQAYPCPLLRCIATLHVQHSQEFSYGLLLQFFAVQLNTQEFHPCRQLWQCRGRLHSL